MKKNITNEEVNLIDKSVLDNYAQHKTDNTWIVQDGIIDLDSYNEAKYRILWILKEVNEVSDMPDFSDVDDWDIREAFKDIVNKKTGLSGWSKTLSPIIYTSFGILNDTFWDGMDDIPEHNYKIVDVLKEIAYINLKKQPGKAIADPNEIKAHFLRDEAVILHQVKKFDPDIIICGGTLNDYLIRSLELKEENAKIIGDVKCYLQDGRIYVRTYHPGAHVNKTEYVDGIINAVRVWKQSKSDKNE